ncbi:MAG: methyltransferase domain-containing protein [Lachnospiraceae bacterium]|nr:methyltransferase domain-containing protein [Lachnospiraceae bacterium]
MNGVDDKKICFIICSSNELYTGECLYYINHLRIPAGYQIEVLTVEDAVSMAAGYNEGMQSSDAKYKVYLHQDVFIVNTDFIQDFLKIFQADEQIGMIGMVGAPQLPASGIMWETKRCGAIYAPAYFHDALSRFDGDTLTEVEAIDGLLMITQYDIPWREDLFDKWDFYDCSQSQEFIRQGYKVVVPALETPWCLHDSVLADLSAYDGERIKFLQEYFMQEDTADQSMAACGITVVLTSYQRCAQLRDTLRWLEEVEGISNIIVADNGSDDDTEEWLATQQYEYVRFDEGVQGYGRLWNAILQNFATQDCIVFLEAGVYPEKRSLLELCKVLQSDDIAMAGPVSNNSASDTGRQINSRDDLTWVRQSSLRQSDGKLYDIILRPNWKMWAVRRDVLEKNGLLWEELNHPENVLTDYSLRMLQGGLRQAVCCQAFAYESFDKCWEVYEEAEQWRSLDRHIMKKDWGMNYFNLVPNRFLADEIQEEAGAEFQVLEVGCDLGATLLEIQNRYPKCKTYGLDINEAAVEIAKHITEAVCGNIDELNLPFQEKFDYIIFGDVLEHLRHPEEVVRMCRSYLNEGGCIIASIPNVMHVSVLEQLIDGRFQYQDIGLLDRTHIHFFTYYEIMRMFQETDYSVREVREVVSDISDRQRTIMETLLNLSDQTEEWMYRTFQYVVKAQK